MGNSIDNTGQIKLRGADDTDSIGYFAGNGGGTNMSLSARSVADHQNHCMPNNDGSAPYKMSEYRSAHKLYGLAATVVQNYCRPEAEGNRGGFKYGIVDLTLTTYAQSDANATPYYYARSVYHGNSQQSNGWISSGSNTTYQFSDLHNNTGDRTWYFYMKDNNGCGAGDSSSGSGPGYGTLAAAEIVDASVTVPDHYLTSDNRLKTDIKYIGKSGKGYNIYSFAYRTNPNRKFSGVMGKEIQEVLPEAVLIDDNGYIKVNYSMLDVELTEIS
tara:strand:- start:18308 stop:19123 length:816 start_codon:yes stop_codon:yes gene_type:complete